MVRVATDPPGATFRIGGDREVHRLGYGALRITGPDNWGEPADRAGMLALLRALPELGIDLVDTADSYGPHVSESLIREALFPYDGLTIATKGGYVRPDARTWIPLGRPEYLLQSARLSARRLGLEQIPLWQLHRIDPNVPRDEQFDAIAQLRAEGLIRHVGLSEVCVEDIEAASAWFPVATVQNRYNLLERRAEPVLRFCEANAIGFIPYFPLGAGKLLMQRDVVEIAGERAVTPAQVALAWLLRHSAVILPIPGSGSIAHVRTNAVACDLALTPQEFGRLSALAAPVETTAGRAC